MNSWLRDGQHSTSQKLLDFFDDVTGRRFVGPCSLDGKASPVALDEAEHLA
ncbi:MAG: hypothetical protein HYW49_08625 [Deltaproteobacteria bacterium]|nr:hypothetical protein [Deltaproteobacteria bacterium]